MLKLRELALQPDFQLGPLEVSPSRRQVEGPAGKANIEPIVMQVLLVLLDGRGGVVTRDELFDQCWGSAIVGDDSLNRAVLKVRRVLEEVAPGQIEIETIPRTGYRLTGEILQSLVAEQFELPGDAPPRHSAISRRLLIGGGAAAAAAGVVYWRLSRPSSDPHFDALMARGDEALRDGTAFEDWDIGSNRSQNMVALYEEAVRLQPDSAKAWGLLAYFRSSRADGASAEDSPRRVAEAQASIRRALELDTNEPNARVAIYLLEGRMLDWIARDRRLRQILATDPSNLLAMMELMPLVQATGLTRESWMWNERILRASPFARGNLVVRSLKLWILGRTRESDNVIDRVRGLWPDYFFGFWARFMLFAHTDRPRAALTMLDSASKKFGGMAEPEMWRASLEALDARSPAAISSARSACMEVARKSPPLVNDIVMLLCSLGEKDAAFEVTEGFLLWRGKVVSTGQDDGKAMDDYSRRMTQWLFTPPVALMRADPRFTKLCDEFGLSAYWRARNVRPDYQVYG